MGDIEASSLLAGFPIEIGWVDENGQGESHLIRPADEWLSEGNTAWSPASERVHGISLPTLLAQGVSHATVANRAAQVLAPRHVTACSGAPATDGRWLHKLLKAGGQRRPVRLVDVNRLYGLACRPLQDLLPLADGPAWDRADERIRNLAREIVARAEEEEALRQRVHHRALPDAETLWRTWQSIREQVALRLAEEAQR